MFKCINMYVTLYLLPTKNTQKMLILCFVGERISASQNLLLSSQRYISHLSVRTSIKNRRK